MYTTDKSKSKVEFLVVNIISMLNLDNQISMIIIAFDKSNCNRQGLIWAAGSYETKGHGLYYDSG